MTAGHALVLGVGNPLMGDDGVGILAVERLRAEYELPDDVTAVDGGTWGMNLLPLIEAADELILIDAIRHGGTPGSHVHLGRDELPRYFAHKVSPHQIDLREVLALAEWRGTLPRVLVALGLEPQRVEMVHALSPVVADQMDELLARVADELARLGHDSPRRNPPAACTS